ncbi:MAG TPA: hypothetical protein VLW49_09535 [Gaiellaceae bacterium]|nr:hypothetical protein [Gaiellaceae bacterium]
MDAPHSEDLPGPPLLVAHLRSLDPQARSARERLEDRLGSALVWKLLFALAPRRSNRRAA